MPLYCIKQGMIDRFGQEELIQLTDRADPPAGIIDDTILNQALDDADGVINSYLAGKYDLPLATVPTTLEPRAAAIARYNLYDNHAPDKIEADRNDAIAWLKDVSRGVASLGVNQSGSEPETNNTAQMESDGRIFGRKNSGGFI